MAEDKVKWTEQQQQAIRQRGRDVLVSASAGTGKTAVLSGRCVDIVADNKEAIDAALARIEGIVAVPEKGTIYKGKVKSHIRITQVILN